MINCITPDEILPGVIEMLQSIKKEGIKAAVCSASKSASFIIDKLKLSEYFDTVVGGNDVKKAKPDPEVFIIASEKFGISSYECTVIEDAFAGLEAARAAGMKAVGLGDDKILTNADVVYKNMKVFSIEDIKGLWRL